MGTESEIWVTINTRYCNHGSQVQIRLCLNIFLLYLFHVVADCCRTARHALAAIARARPGVFITSVAKEIARYNTLATNAQTLNVNLQMHVLTRSKAEVLHVVEQLIATDSALSDMRDLLTDVVDIVLHCVDHNHLKQRPLSEVFPPIQTFNQVILTIA